MQQVFDHKAQAWLEYTDSVRGKLRHAVILHHLRAHLPAAPAKVLDVGGGTGELAADLARAGHTVTLLDFAPAMIEQAQRRCAGLNVSFVCAAADQIPERLATFDTVLCHSLLEFVSHPQELLQQLADVLRAGGLLSVVVGNRYHAPLRAALLQRDFVQARLGLDSEMPATDLFGLPRRTFCPEEMREMMRTCDVVVVGEYGVRVFADLLDDAPELTEELLALELAASPRLPYRHLARFVHFTARKG